MLSTLTFITLGDHLADPTINGPDSHFMEEEADEREAASSCWSGTEAELTPRFVGSLPSRHHTQRHALRIKHKIHLTKEAEMCTQNYRDTIKAITEISKDRDCVFMDCKLHGRKGPQVSQQIPGNPVSMKPGFGRKVTD